MFPAKFIYLALRKYLKRSLERPEHIPSQSQVSDTLPLPSQILYGDGPSGVREVLRMVAAGSPAGAGVGQLQELGSPHSLPFIGRPARELPRPFPGRRLHGKAEHFNSAHGPSRISPVPK